jgi:hypothetical protein
MAFSFISLPWLLETNNTGVRYLALRDLIGLPQENPELIKAKNESYKNGQIGEVLKHMDSDGYWVRSGSGYNPKYYSGVWSLILLSQLGASVKDDERIGKACAYYLDHAFTKDRSVSSNGVPSGVVDCLQGNMCGALNDLGYEDKRLDLAYDWMARSVVGDGVKYYAYKCGPNFVCGANGKKSCAWGATKVTLALGKLKKSQQTPVIVKAIQAGVDFLLSTDPVRADYPTRTDTKPSRDWWKFGFPVFYITDLLQIVEAILTVGHGNDPRLKNALDYILSKQDRQGRFLLEYDYSGKTWGDFGEKNQPNKWVTYRVLKILKNLNRSF